MPTITETVHHASGTYVRGSELPADHELVKAAPHLFERIAGGEVEQATAAPGEKRAVKKSAARKA